jgi:hypothetical protein
MEGDGENPIFEVQGRAEGVQILICSEESLLGGVLGLFPASQDAPGEREHSRLTTVDDHVERLPVSGQATVDDLPVIHGDRFRRDNERPPSNVYGR